MAGKILSAGLILTILWFIQFNPYEKIPSRLLLASTVLLLGSAPLIFWLFKPEKTRLPLFQTHCLFYAVCFGLPGFFDDFSTLQAYVAEEWMQAAQIAAIVGILSLNIGYGTLRKYHPSWVHLRSSPIRISPATRDWFVLYLPPFVFVVRLAFAWLEIEALDQLTNTLWLFLFAYLTTEWLRKTLTGLALYGYLGIYLPGQLVMGLGGGAIAGILSLAIVLGIVFVAIKRRLPWLLVLVAAAVFILLQPVKSKYRMLTWEQDFQGSALDKTQLFFELGIMEYTQAQSARAETLQMALETTMIRLNHLHMTAAIMRDTPNPEPYRNGSTYLPLVTKLIPRFLWAEKYEERLGNNWPKDYGYMNPNDMVTVYNLPWLPEAFMNFGWLGVIVFNLIIGGFFGCLHILWFDRPKDSAGIAFAVAVGSSLIFVESNVSLMLGMLMVGVIVLMAAGWGIKQVAD